MGMTVGGGAGVEGCWGPVARIDPTYPTWSLGLRSSQESALLCTLTFPWVGKGELEAGGGWNSQSSTQDELGKGTLEHSTPVPFPPP